jgi:type IV pilus assembly protein PilA
MRQEDSKSNSTLPKGCGCLVLLMCIGVMGAIPSFLNMVDRAPRSEAKQYLQFIENA